MESFDLIVIGGGVIGTAVLRSLAFYNAKTLLIEKASDLSAGASRANSGIVHAGYDAEPGTKKAHFNVLGAAMMPSLCSELHVPYKRTGSLVAAREGGEDKLKELKARADKNGVKAEIIGKDEITKLEPNISPEIVAALYAPEAGVVSPYKLTIAQGDFAALNGATVRLEERPTGIESVNGGFKVRTNRGEYFARTLVNAAGAGASGINALLGEKIYDEVFAAGDYYILDSTERGVVNTVVFPLPDERGKGILVAPTADGNVILGPTSRRLPSSDGEDTSVTTEGLAAVREGAARLVPSAKAGSAIRVYAGVRTSVGKDFIIEESALNPGYFILAGICSPGLTSAPAIGEHVALWAAEKLGLERKKEIKPLPEAFHLSAASPEEIAAKIKEDPSFGRVVCRCETVTEGEIVRAIRSPVPARTVDAVKRRVRAGMGRCQGGFCMPRILEILARELSLPLNAIRKGDEGSEIAPYEVKDGYDGI